MKPQPQRSRKDTFTEKVFGFSPPQPPATDDKQQIENLSRKAAKLCNETGGYGTKFAEDEFYEIIKSILRQYRSVVAATRGEQWTYEKVAQLLGMSEERSSNYNLVVLRDVINAALAKAHQDGWYEGRNYEIKLRSEDDAAIADRGREHQPATDSTEVEELRQQLLELQNKYDELNNAKSA